MSGIEVLGVVASIVQIADLGGRLSVKLCTFCHKVKNANKALRYLSKDVALTCNVLRQLGESLGQDDLASLYSPDAFETAQSVLKECKQVFQDLESAIEQHCPDPNSQSRIDKVARKLKFLMNESQLETVAGNLERLKSTMLLMLNVIIYAGQIRSRRETHELQEQRNLLLVLTSEKIESEKNYERLTRTLQFTSLTETSTNLETSAVVPDQPEETRDELYHYCQMVKAIIHDINNVQHLLDQSRYHRVRNGFVKLHTLETTLLQRDHGQRAASLFRAHLPDELSIIAGGNSAAAMSPTSGDQNNATSPDPRAALASKLLQFDVSKMSLEQISEHLMHLTSAIHQLRRQPTVGTNDSVAHQERDSQILRLEKQRVTLLHRYRALYQAKQTQASSMANSSDMPQIQAQQLQSQNSAVSQAPAKPQANAASPQFQARQFQSQNSATAQSPSRPQMCASLPRTPTQAARISAMEQVTSMVQMGMTQQQIQAQLQILRNRAAAAQSQSAPQMNAAPAPTHAQEAYMFASQHASSVRQMQMSQLQMQPQQSRSRQFIPPMPQMQLSSANLEKLNQLFTQSSGDYKPPSNAFNTTQSDPLPRLQSQAPRMRSRSGAPKHINLPDVQLSPSETPFSMPQSSASEVKQSLTDLVAPETSAFNLDFSAVDNSDVLEGFDFDSFLNEGENQKDSRSNIDPPRSNQSSCGAAPLQRENQDTQVDQSNSGDHGNVVPATTSRKRKVNAATSASDSPLPLPNPATTPEERPAKRIELDADSSMGETVSAGPSQSNELTATETKNLPSAATDSQTSTSKDAPLEALDNWILRWTTLEQMELK